jgi:hypothetical protein
VIKHNKIIPFYLDKNKNQKIMQGNIMSSTFSVALNSVNEHK